MTCSLNKFKPCNTCEHWFTNDKFQGATVKAEMCQFKVQTQLLIEIVLSLKGIQKAMESTRNEANTTTQQLLRVLHEGVKHIPSHQEASRNQIPRYLRGNQAGSIEAETQE